MTKKDIFLRLIKKSCVYVYINPKGWENALRLPDYLTSRDMVTLQYGLNMPVPIIGLEATDLGIKGTLSFKTVPHFCFVPWDNVFAIVNEDFRGMVWKKDAPASLAKKNWMKPTAGGIDDVAHIYNESAGTRGDTIAKVVDIAQYRKARGK